MSSDTIPSIISRGLPNAVTYDMREPGSVTITLPRHSTWSSGLHWHEDHDEYLKVVQGSVHVLLNGIQHILTATGDHQPEVKVPRHAWHSWRRADLDGIEEEQDDVIVVERTEPVDLAKKVFFWNLNGVILEAPALDGRLAALPQVVRGVVVDFWVTLGLFVIFYHLDNFPVFVDVPVLLGRYLPAFFMSLDSVLRIAQGAEWLVTHATLLSAACLGWVLGIRPVQQRFTPASVFAEWNESKLGVKKLS